MPPLFFIRRIQDHKIIRFRGRPRRADSRDRDLSCNLVIFTFLLHCVISQSTNVTDSRTDGRHARSVSATCIKCYIKQQGRRSQNYWGDIKENWGSGDEVPKKLKLFCETTHNSCIKIQQITVVAVTG